MTSTSRLSIVVADDDLDICELLRMKFESLGFEVFTVLDGSRVLELVDRTRPSIVILDIILPGMSGMEVLQQIRTTASIKDTLVILMTSDRQEKDAARGFSLGIVAFITKPFSLKDIATAVQNALTKL